MKVDYDKKITIDYSFSIRGDLGTKKTGELCFHYGKAEAITAIEKNILGKSIGDEISFVALSEDAWGNHNKDLVFNIPLTKLFENINKKEIRLGNQIQVNNSLFKITDIKSQYVELDANHPLAGLSFDFWVKIKKIEDCTGSCQSCKE